MTFLGKQIIAALSGPVIFVVSFNSISLLYRHHPSLLNVGGYIFLSLLSMIPFLPPLLGFRGIRESQGQKEKELRYRRAMVSYKAALLFTFALFLWAAYMEEGRMSTGGMPIAMYAVMFLVLPMTLLVAEAGRMDVPNVEEEDAGKVDKAA